jgi:tetratricopeptide (TPR) repeat protein
VIAGNQKLSRLAAACSGARALARFIFRSRWAVKRAEVRALVQLLAHHALAHSSLTFTFALVGFSLSAGVSSSSELFQRGSEAYRAKDFAAAVEAFRGCVVQQPGAGVLQNLGLAEWQSGNVGEAVLAWERAGWLDPANRAAKINLEFARANAQLAAPELAWYEVPSTWLSADSWAWLASLALWFTAGIIIVPVVLRKRRTTWQQALAAAGLVVFLISVPAQLGVWTRSRIGFVIGKGVALRLTPTLDAETLTQLAPGEPVRWVRARGNYLFVRTSRSNGWLEKKELGLVCPR